MSRQRPLICGNWKLHHSVAQSRLAIKQLQTHLQSTPIQVAIAPVAVALESSCRMAKSKHTTPIDIAAQNVFHAPQGAFTGEWSVQHLRELGCTFALVGHSERRQLFGESDALVARKVEACLQKGITPIACIGESSQQHQQGEAHIVLKKQLTSMLQPLSSRLASRLVIAYEPVWAIGTGQAAQPQQIQDTLAFVRLLIQRLQGPHVAQQVRLLYGGSVSKNNAYAFMQQPHIDGLLVGGASLHAHTFIQVIQQAHKGWLAAK
ncbi:MAG: triose-phosphate isomerase [Myxococcota bacterium]